MNFVYQPSINILVVRPKSTLRYTPELEEIAQEFIDKKIENKKNKDTDQVGTDLG